MNGNHSHYSICPMCAVYVFVSYRLFVLTGTLKDVVVPNKTGKEMVRNFSTFAAAAVSLWLAAWIVLASMGLEGPRMLLEHGVNRPHFDP